jgi:hypothetical protein
MKKTTTLIAGLGAIAVLLAITTFGGNSGVSDPVVSLTKLSATGGRAQHDAIVTDLNSMATAVNAIIDVLDAVQYETGTATNGQVVALANTYTAAPVVLVHQVEGTNATYAASVTTSNFTMTVVGNTNAVPFVVIPKQ